jgi:EAL domain-containing protein (putative c-di-GMP-specific phosphodiesterase class I)
VALIVGRRVMPLASSIPLEPGRSEEFNQRAHSVTHALPEALASSDRLHLVYQPRLGLADGVVAGVEALLRWRHPDLGPISPAEFVPIAETAGMMSQLTGWVIERALGEYRRLAAVWPGLILSFNVSSSNLDEDDFVERLEDALMRHEIEPGLIELEFTEDQIIPDDARTRATLARLNNLGVRMSIDDFGAGHSNLNYLRAFPADTLKIDQQFIRDLASNDRDQIIVQSVVSLGRALNYRVVAEGVEDAKALALLKSWACDEAQGHHICPPIPLDEIERWLAGKA